MGAIFQLRAARACFLSAARRARGLFASRAGREIVSHKASSA
jgi:hypothetical protein